MNKSKCYYLWFSHVGTNSTPIIKGTLEDCHSLMENLKHFPNDIAEIQIWNDNIDIIEIWYSPAWH